MIFSVRHFLVLGCGYRNGQQGLDCWITSLGFCGLAPKEDWIEVWKMLGLIVPQLEEGQLL